MERNRLDPDEPMMLESGGAANALMPRPGEAGLRGYLPEQPDWLKAIQHNPIVSRFLGEALPLALMGMRAPAGAGGTLPMEGARMAPSGRIAPETALREWATPRVADRPYEWPVEAAVKVDDQIFTGPNHIDGLMKAQAALGEDVFLHRLQGAKQQGIEDGFVTNAGRYVTREEAGRLADERNQTNHYGISRVTGRPKQGMDSFLGEALKNYDPITGREKQ